MRWSIVCYALGICEETVLENEIAGNFFAFINDRVDYKTGIKKANEPAIVADRENIIPFFKMAWIAVLKGSL